MKDSSMSGLHQATIDLAKDGNTDALEALVVATQDQIYKLALRMLADTAAAEDATQEILIRIITKLSTFQGDSKFETWTYRIATNYLLTARKVIARDPGLSFQMFADDLLDGLADEGQAAPEDHIMLNELRIKCTMALLLCLDRDHRAAYVFGDILELEHVQSADILKISPVNFRKRLSRARASVLEATAANCGLANPSAACSCRKRLPVALAQGRVGHSPKAELSHKPSFSEVKTFAEKLQPQIAAAKLQRATGPLDSPKDYAESVLRLIERTTS
jgi:RNA polymerase sigma factor (sigma-70 family)